MVTFVARSPKQYFSSFSHQNHLELGKVATFRFFWRFLHQNLHGHVRENHKSQSVNLKTALFWVITQQVVEFLTDVSEKTTGPIFRVQEPKRKPLAPLRSLCR